ncbi:autotransporter assembly complex protein TamA [Psychrobacter glacincola]|uniref:autotransporter assembly complex protein TamA n=1 Tax=Psychrobacter glacincola TaxID=56810 RepID=UPI0039AF3C24
MKHQPSTPAPSLRVMSPDNLGHKDGVNKSSAASNTIDAPRLYFSRTALFSALTTSLVGFGCSMAPAAFAATADVNNSNINNSQTMIKKAATSASEMPNTSSVSTVQPSISNDSQTDIALDALRLKKAVEQGIIDQSVLDDYSEQTLGIKKPKSGSKNSNNNEQLNIADTNENIEQQAAAIQQQGYQMMTPDEIDRELAAMDRQNAQDIDNISSNNVGSANNSGFNAPIATLDAIAPPIGLDIELDASSLPTPSNLDTLGISETAADRAETAEIMSRPIEVSDAVSSGSASQTIDNDILANINQEKNTAGSINPNDYLPDYQNDTEAVSESIEQAKTPSPMARNKGNIVKRLYDRLFNAGSLALPHIDTTIYLQQVAANTNAVTSKTVLVKADNDVQPMKNIKAALDETTVQSVIDFTAALPRLRQTAVDAAKAVGYYDISLRLRQPYTNTIDVVIEKLGEPVRVDSRIVDIRGEGSEQKEFAALEKDLPPKEGDIFNHRVYKDSKSALESLSNTYGYFDQYWLNKSVDIILPDNTADVSLVYNTGNRYKFDEVVFFTYDKESGTLTRDPAKLPVELSLLRQLFDFKEGDPFYRPAVTKFSNDLSATRYFNTINVESILPPDERTQSATLAFDNTLNTDTNGDSVDLLDGDINNASDVSNARQIDGIGNDGAIYSSSGEKVNAADIAAIEFSADEETLEKLQAIKQKAERLSRLPSDRVLDEKDQKSNNILGKISDSISDIVQKVFPDEKNILADENFVPPTLAGRKTPEEVLESKKVPLYVFVSANKPRDAQVGLGYGTDTGVRATAKIDYNLLNRKGYQAGFETEVSRITKNASVYASRPWKHPLNDKLDARLTYEEEVIDQGEGNFDLSTKTVKAALTRNIRRENSWNRSYSLRYRLDELETGIDDTQLDDLPIRFTSSTPRQQALLLGYGINKTDVDSATNPTRGIRQYYSIEAGADKALSETNLAIARAGVSGIYSFGSDDKHQVLGSINTGYIWADDFYEVPYKLRFFAGGDQSIRGYDYESLSPIDKGYLTGGQILAVGSAEYNYEFKPGFRGAVFTDIGNAYDKDFETDTKVGVGVGIRWASPVGVVRVDVAAGVTEENIPVRLHLFIGSPL